MFFDRVAILGVGLIGASFALALKRHGLCKHITGFGRREENLIRAREMGIIDSFELDPSAASSGSDLIMFALPVGCFTGVAGKIRDSLKEGVIVTDAGSVKGRLVCEMEDILYGKAVFIGAHPIAGSDRAGIGAADAGLFYRNRCIITPGDKTDKAALGTVISLWQAIGAVVETMSPEEHDRVFAAVSHLPHIIAYEIVNTAAEVDEKYLRYAGQGFRDITRIASSSPELWRDICIANRENILTMMDMFIKRLERVRDCLKNSEADSLENEFMSAKSLRDGIGKS